MIDKTQATKNGIKIIDSTKATNALFDMLQTQFPQTIKDGQPDLNAIANLLGLQSSNMQGYELTFTGKGLANALYNTPCEKVLTLKDSFPPTNTPPQTPPARGFVSTKNAIIIGDNLDALKILKSAYTEKIKMIYIDPPYNTANDNFIYPDNFREDYKAILREVGLIEIDENGEETESENLRFFKNIQSSRTHSGWLSFMLPRLKLARDLLKEDGVIFISIDDNEQANLKILCDEIFGEDNFVYQLSVVDKLNGNDNSSGMMETQEHCLIYAKDKSLFEMGVLPIEEEVNNGWQEDDLGWWKEGGSLKATGENAPREKRPNLFYSIFIDEKNLTFSLEKDAKHIYELLPITDNKEMSWYWKKEKMINEANEVIIKKTNGGYSLYKKQRPALGDMPSKRGKTTFYSPKYSTANSNAEIQKIFNAKVFSYSKSKDLIKDLISLSNTNSNDIILDFFAGSGTTAQAVMELNAEDNGNRQFILVQLDEKIDSAKSKVAYDFCKNELKSDKPTISDITTERVRRVSTKIATKLAKENVDLGFKLYSLESKSKLISDEKGALELMTSKLNANDKALNLALQSGKTLDKPIEIVIENKLYKCEDSYFCVECDEPVLKALSQTSDEYIYIDAYSNINLEHFLNLDARFKERLNVVY